MNHRPLEPNEQIDVTKPYIRPISSAPIGADFIAIRAILSPDGDIHITKAFLCWIEIVSDDEDDVNALEGGECVVAYEGRCAGKYYGVRDEDAGETDHTARYNFPIDATHWLPLSRSIPDTPAERDWSEVAEKLTGAAAVTYSAPSSFNDSIFRGKALRILQEADKPVEPSSNIEPKVLKLISKLMCDIVEIKIDVAYLKAKQ